MNKRIIVGIIIVILAGLIIAGASVIKHFINNLEVIDNLVIENVNLDEIADGDYYGSYSSPPISCEVKVTVYDHNITKIVIISHKSGKGQEGEAITDRVINEQSLDIDLITGATYSSKVILKAIEQALKGD